MRTRQTVEIDLVRHAREPTQTGSTLSECLFNRDRPADNAIRECFAFDKLKNQVAHSTGFFVNGRNVGVIEGCQYLCFPLETAHSIYITGKFIRILIATSRFNFRSLALHLAHAALAEQTGDLMRAELCADGQSHDFALDYRTAKVVDE
jgi:hypothetical protein